jgi:hypothetical protein
MAVDVAPGSVALRYERSRAERAWLTFRARRCCSLALATGAWGRSANARERADPFPLRASDTPLSRNEAAGITYRSESPSRWLGARGE